MNVIVARTYEEAHYFCQMVADPPIDPHHRTTTIFSTSVSDNWQKSRGRKFQKGDKLFYYGRYYEGRYAGDIDEILRPSFLGAEVTFEEIVSYA